MRLIDADKVPQLSDMIGCANEGGEYQAYKSGAEYGRGLVFWPLLVVTHIGITIYRIVRRLTK